MDTPLRASFRFQIFPSSGVPIYRQLMDQVVTQVSSGLLKPGVLLPAVRQVAEDLQVNPMTVSKAYSLLERDGVLELQRGRGMLVKEPKTVGSARERQETFRPHAEQMVAKARQLSLTATQAQAVIDPLLKELGG